MAKVNILLTLFNLIPSILAICLTQSPFYPPPSYNSQSSEVWEALGLWDKISLRSLASQLSGLPRDWVKDDVLTDPDSVDITIKCDPHHSHMPCTAQDLLDNLTRRPALFALNIKSTYLNLGFDLLGLVLVNVTGTTSEEYITSAILHPLGISQTSFAKPLDSESVPPKGDSWYFNVDLGVEKPTGGLYSSLYDMSVFLCYILAEYKDIADAKLNWLLSVSFMAGMGSFYGMLWEIFRTDRILLSDDKRRARTVMFFTKGGGLLGYRTLIVLVPEYDLGIMILTAGDETFLDVLLEMVAVPLIRAADELAARQVKETYVGSYTSPSTKEQTVNSTLTLSYTSTHGLEINEWISNSTDVLSIISKHFQSYKNTRFHAQ
ncbi:hypothetical protein Aspvir_002277 [Aspergillus viridinutans]|uniref:Uncharacterized protein n=1 Tax=Aspergillus viridinutans TaxID=75553 RepID=A0A9P3F5N4_ASPVI|nr:uncharacterized protein Aspvir_002277 [Aspergillus viridinutans]GIK06627.1 hypothetical protein Aspvir_002277 [Aspergillus viridinutans]